MKSSGLLIRWLEVQVLPHAPYTSSSVRQSMMQLSCLKVGGSIPSSCAKRRIEMILNNNGDVDRITLKDLLESMGAKNVYVNGDHIAFDFKCYTCIHENGETKITIEDD